MKASSVTNSRQSGYDVEPLSESLLASATAPSATSKHKIIELHNPSQVVELKSVGTLSFKWSFKWEEHEFEWKREECFMIRKPDPAVLVAVTKEPPGKLKTAAIQILDYNLHRFDIEDRRGLEITLLTALLTFHDMNDVFHTPQEPSPKSPQPSQAQRRVSDSAPPPPPKPAPKTGVDRIAEIHAIRGNVNEITVEDEGSVDDFARYATNLLEDEAMLFISIHASSAVHVPKVLQVVEETKRIRHKRGLQSETELHQYVVYDNQPSSSRGGPRRIVLDDPRDKWPGKGNYTPPSSLTIHLSKIPMPELEPRPTPNSSTPPERTPSRNQDSADPTGKKHRTFSRLLLSRTHTPPITDHAHSHRAYTTLTTKLKLPQASQPSTKPPPLMAPPGNAFTSAIKPHAGAAAHAFAFTTEQPPFIHHTASPTAASTTADIRRRRLGFS
ncbi:hypothetical protein EW146_g6498 [Bondarzewia mesenterica]|uniref:Uncharacterized protein n=1 Tax=Bondarzewia mesenterica TaxID=1095465 RepID=A0A4S4LNG9_9AGAM|nr:hypothetical protein EW146_g6498 [Bondarzewia mesenterica]